MRAAVIATTLAGVTALVPSGVPQKAVEAKVVDRRTVGAGLLSAIGAFSAQAAHASAGDSPKFSFFGIGGNADTFSEGAAYGIDQSAETYSPYSPFTAPSGSSVYSKFNADEIAFKKKLLAESSKRVAKVDKYIEKKQWEEVRSELERQVYSMRGTMNYLASGKAEAAAKATEFYQAMEAVNLYAKQKKQPEAAAAYTSMMSALTAYSKLI